MLFNSQIFLFVFLPVVLVGWWRMRADRARLLYLTLMSYLFYGWWDARFIPLMIASTTIDYVAGAKIAATDEQRSRKRWLIWSLTFNLAILGFFKYYGMAAESINAAATYFGLHRPMPVFNVILPIGISFYTFNSMSYTIDVYRRRVRPAASLLSFSAFVAMFPHLIAGPIVRFSDIEDQLRGLKVRLTSNQAAVGIFFFAAGFAKKLLIADQLGPHVDAWFAGSSWTFGDAWLAALGYTFQLYFDFSGYSDMAVGLAHFLGFQFPQNFNSPYKAADISDFWRRWHVSLSSWLRDYLFIPLGGSRGSQAKTLRNLTITMALGGVWHGAQWTFVLWGLYHGMLLTINALLARWAWWGRASIFRPTVTFIAVVFGWVLFRASSLQQTTVVWSAMLGGRGLTLGSSPQFGYLATLLLAGAVAFKAPNVWEIRFEPQVVFAYVLGTVVVIGILLLERPSPFLYFQF